MALFSINRLFPEFSAKVSMDLKVQTYIIMYLV
jgi:hypothetical protein